MAAAGQLGSKPPLHRQQNLSRADRQAGKQGYSRLRNDAAHLTSAPAHRHTRTCDQREAVEGRLIDAAHLVEHKQAGQQHSKGEDLGAVLPGLQPARQGAGRTAAMQQRVKVVLPEL
jgi:hypothetical protein